MSRTTANAADGTKNPPLCRSRQAAAEKFGTLLVRLEADYLSGQRSESECLRALDRFWPHHERGFDYYATKTHLSLHAGMAVVCARFALTGSWIRHLYQSTSDRTRWLRTALELVMLTCPLAPESALNFVRDDAVPGQDPSRLPLRGLLILELALSLTTDEPAEAIRLADTLMADRYPDRIGNIRGVRGVALKNLGRFQEAEAELRLQIEILRKHHLPPRLLGNALGNYATVCLHLNRIADARRALEESQTINPEQKKGIYHAMNLMRFTNMAIARSDLPKAFEFCVERLRIAERCQIGEAKMAAIIRASALNDMGVIYQELAEWQTIGGPQWSRIASQRPPEAVLIPGPLSRMQWELIPGVAESRELCLKRFREAHDISAEQNDLTNQAVVLRNLGIAHRAFGSPADAIRALLGAAALQEQSAAAVGVTRWELSMAFDRAGERGKAISEGREALRQMRKMDQTVPGEMRLRQIARWLLYLVPGLAPMIHGAKLAWSFVGFLVAWNIVAGILFSPDFIVSNGELAAVVGTWLVGTGCLSALSELLRRTCAGVELIESQQQFRIRRYRNAERYMPLFVSSLVLSVVISAQAGLEKGLKCAVAVSIVSGTAFVWPEWIGRRSTDRMKLTLFFVGVLVAAGVIAASVAGAVRDWAGAGWKAWLTAFATGMIASIFIVNRVYSRWVGLVSGVILGRTAGAAAGETVVTVVLSTAGAVIGLMVGEAVGGFLTGVLKALNKLLAAEENGNS